MDAIADGMEDLHTQLMVEVLAYHEEKRWWRARFQLWAAKVNLKCVLAELKETRREHAHALDMRALHTQLMVEVRDRADEKRWWRARFQFLAATYWRKTVMGELKKTRRGVAQALDARAFHSQVMVQLVDHVVEMRWGRAHFERVFATLMAVLEQKCLEKMLKDSNYQCDCGLKRRHRRPSTSVCDDHEIHACELVATSNAGTDPVVTSILSPSACDNPTSNDAAASNDREARTCELAETCGTGVEGGDDMLRMYEEERATRERGDAKLAAVMARLAKERSARMALKFQLQRSQKQAQDREALANALEEAKICGAIARPFHYQERAARFTAEHKLEMKIKECDNLRTVALRTVNEWHDQLDELSAAHEAVMAVGRASRRARRPQATIERIVETKAFTSSTSPEAFKCLRAQNTSRDRLAAHLKMLSEVGQWRVEGHAVDNELLVHRHGSQNNTPPLQAREIAHGLVDVLCAVTRSVQDAHAMLDLVADNDQDKPWLVARHARLEAIASHTQQWLQMIETALFDCRLAGKFTRLPARPQPLVWAMPAATAPTATFSADALRVAQDKPSVPAQDVVAVEHMVCKFVLAAYKATIHKTSLYRLCTMALETKRMEERCSAAVVWHQAPLPSLAVTAMAVATARERVMDDVSTRMRQWTQAQMLIEYAQACSHMEEPIAVPYANDFLTM